MSEVPELLSELKQADRNLEAGPEIEGRVIAAFRRRRTQRVCGRVLTLAGAIAAVIVIVVIPPRPPSARVERPSLRAGALPAPKAPSAAIPPAAVPVKKESAPRHRQFTNTELATDFFPLMDTPPPFERGELLRVVVPAATMLQVGLPVSQEHWADPVQADILLGQEGLARAIRFVSYGQ
jgi:hypothetical protein